MANEIVIGATTGLTVTVQLYSGTSTQGTAFSATEIGTTGVYVATMPSTPYGHYSVVGLAGGAVISSGDIYWDGAYEMPVGLSMLQGLDKNNPMTVTPTSRVTGSITLTLSGDGVTTETATRV